MKLRTLITAVCSSLIITSCATTVSVNTVKTGGAELHTRTEISGEALNIIRGFTGGDSSSPLFTEEDLVKLLKDIGGFNIKAEVLSEKQFESSCYVPDFDSGVFKKLNIITVTQTSASLTLGPEQMKSLYNQLTSESQGYFDLLMAPVITGEKLNLAEYRALLSSVYGPKLAAELTDGPLTITLTSPDGKKAETIRLTIGEVMTLSKEKTWQVTW